MLSNTGRSRRGKKRSTTPAAKGWVGGENPAERKYLRGKAGAFVRFRPLPSCGIDETYQTMMSETKKVGPTRSKATPHQKKKARALKKKSLPSTGGGAPTFFRRNSKRGTRPRGVSSALFAAPFLSRRVQNDCSTPTGGSKPSQKAGGTAPQRRERVPATCGQNDAGVSTKGRPFSPLCSQQPRTPPPASWCNTYL